MYSLVIDSPVTLHQQVMNALGSESGPLSGQGSHLAKQAILVIRSTRLVTLRTARLTDVLDRLDVLILSQAPNGDKLQRSFAGDVRGLPVSLRGFLQNIHIESLVSHELLQASVFFLKGF